MHLDRTWIFLWNSLMFRFHLENAPKMFCNAPVSYYKSLVDSLCSKYSSCFHSKILPSWSVIYKILPLQFQTPPGSSWTSVWTAAAGTRWQPPETTGWAPSAWRTAPSPASTARPAGSTPPTTARAASPRPWGRPGHSSSPETPCSSEDSQTETPSTTMSTGPIRYNSY